MQFSKKKIENKSKLMENIADTLKNCSDFTMQKVIAEGSNIEIYKLYFNMLINVQIIDEEILKPLANNLVNINNTQDLQKLITEGKIYHSDIKVETDKDKIIEAMLDGCFALVCEEQGYVFDTRNYSRRSIDEPQNESVVLGPREGFIEARTTNISLIRRRLQTPKLKVIDEDVGTETKTKVSVLYMEGTANQELVNDVLERIRSIDIPALISITDFEENMVERKYSVFPQLVSTEKPDKVAANIIEGKVAVIIDGFPMVYIMPAVFAMFMQAPEEYNINYFVSSFIRLLRYLSTFITLTLPGLYISVITFHQEMLPTTLAKSIIASKQDVPLPAYLEIIIMLLAFEILLEAGNRMPKTAGQTVSIVGALIVGEAAVNAKFVSPAVVVIVAASAICGFVIPSPDMSNAVRLGRMFLVVTASLAGLYGMSLALITAMYYLSGMTSFKTAYLKPFADNGGKALLADTLIRTPSTKKKDKMVRWKV